MKPAQPRDVLALQRDEERVRALRALLMTPLMGADHDAFALVRRHVDALRDFLARETGWLLLLERDSARLLKRPADLSDASRGAPGFDRRRYVLLCLSGAALERADAQITLRALGEELMRLASEPALSDAGFRFTLEHAHERRELVAVCRFLIACGVLSRVAGDEDAFVNEQEARTGDALYDVRRRVLAQLLAGARGPSTYPPGQEPTTLSARLEALTDDGALVDTPEGRRAAVRHRLARRLLDDPAVYLDELSEEAREYFTNQRGPLCARLCEAAGLVSEHRAEGSALVDPEGELSDARMPAEGTLAHATLLVAEHLAARLEGVRARAASEEEVVAFLREARSRYGRYWRKADQEPGSELGLARDALAELTRLKLVSLRGGAVLPLPALARYAVAAPAIKQRQLSLT
jgi:uncharacterized protein (TIGR02678 family)